MGATESADAAFEQVSEDRYDNYASLSRLFRIEIDPELLRDLCDSPVAASIGNEDFDKGYAQVRAYLDGIADIAKGKSELAIDFNYTFIGYGVDPSGEAEDAGAINAAYPYESVYRTGRKTLTGGAAEGVSALYREEGFHPTRYRIAADDHIACELEFLQYLVGQEIASAREGGWARVAVLRGVEARFIDEHLLNWIDLFRQQIEARSETAFYPGAALMTKGWLEYDAAFLRSAREGE